MNLNGNQFGDEGCESLISQMGSSGIGHKLDSLDEDNEPDDDEEDEEPLQFFFRKFRAPVLIDCIAIIFPYLVQSKHPIF